MKIVQTLQKKCKALHDRRIVAEEVQDKTTYKVRLESYLRTGPQQHSSDTAWVVVVRRGRMDGN